MVSPTTPQTAVAALQSAYIHRARAEDIAENSEPPPTLSEPETAQAIDPVTSADETDPAPEEPPRPPSGPPPAFLASLLELERSLLEAQRAYASGAYGQTGLDVTPAPSTLDLIR